MKQLASFNLRIILGVLCHVNPEDLAAGSKQHGGLISRHDQFSGARLSVTTVTTSWSDGTAGPLGICFPLGMFGEQEVTQFNNAHRGEAFLFSSEKRSHFMSGEQFVILLKELLGQAFTQQRAKHSLPGDTLGMLLADGWSGYHSFSTGLDLVRSLWASENRVLLPDLQIGGWSASNQPVDQVHAIFRTRLDLVDASDAGCHADLRSREKYQNMPIKANGQVARPKLNSSALAERTVRAWQSM